MTIRNGVDLDAVDKLAESIKREPSLARVSFSLNSEWKGGFRAQSETSSVSQAGKIDDQRTVTFSLESDEPHVLLGEDSAASAGEYVLKALAACYAVTFAANAASVGVDLDALRFRIEGDFDLRGFLGLDDNVRPGLQEVRVEVELSSPNASQEELLDLVQRVEKYSPIRDTLEAHVPVKTQLVTRSM